MVWLLTLMLAALSPNTHQELTWCVEQARPRAYRNIFSFARDELVIVEGPFAGERWRPDRQPIHRVALATIAQGRWPRTVMTGCVQSGKSVFGYVLPAIYHLGEIGEPVVLFAPTVDLAKTKWTTEIRPIMWRNPRLRRLLPVSGAGSREGVPDLIEFRNGARLKFMGAKGSDATKSSFTARVIVGTEVDKMDRAGQASRESSPIRQIEDRAAAYDEENRCVYFESTVSIERGCIWIEYLQSTRSRFAVVCLDCGQAVTPEREHLIVDLEAPNRYLAGQSAYWECPACRAHWDDEIRGALNQGIRLLHEGQSLDPTGQIVGEPRQTDTLGIRWNAFCNLLHKTSTIAAGEWDAAHGIDDADTEDLEKQRRQKVWAIPWVPPELDLIPLNPQVLKRRVRRGLPKGLLPADTEHLTIGLDLHRRIGWWFAAAWRPEGRCHVPDYGTIEIASDALGFERALLIALRDFREKLEETGFLLPDGQIRIPDQVFLDARYQSEKRSENRVVYAFCREAGLRYRPVLGYGTGQEHPDYSRPTKTGDIVRLIADGYHINWSPVNQVFIVHGDADAWKTRLHQAIALPIGAEGEIPPGAMTFYDSPDGNEHVTLVKHLTAETWREEFVPEKGLVQKWIRKSRANHLFDAGWLAFAAGHLCGVRIVRTEPAPIAGAPRPVQDLPRLGPGWRPTMPWELARG